MAAQPNLDYEALIKSIPALDKLLSQITLEELQAGGSFIHSFVTKEDGSMALLPS
jgi:hypothetical protein